MHALTFTYADTAIRVQTTRRGDLDWLVEFLSPDFAVSPDAPAGRRVSLVIDRAAFAALHARGPDPAGRSIGCFALDGRVQHHARWTGADDEIVACDERTRVFLRRAADGDLEIVAERPRTTVRAILLRAVRESVTAHLDALGAIVIHAAALVWQGRTYVFAGHKGAGKTTVLLHLLTGTGAAYLANDRVVAVPGSDGPAARGMPTIVRIRASSFPRLPDLVARAGQTAYHHRLTVAEAEDLREPVTPIDPGGALSISPAQLLRLLGGVSRVSDVPFGAIVFPRQTGRAGAFSLRRLSPSAAAERLRATLFQSGAAIVGELFAEPRHADLTAAWDARGAICAEVTRVVPCLECAMGVDVYAGPASAAVLLKALEAASAR